MTTCITTLLLRRRFFSTPHLTKFLYTSLGTQQQFLSTSNKPFYYDNPSQYVAGVTTSDLDQNPQIAAFFEANFTEEFFGPTKKEEEQKQREEEKEEFHLAKLNIRPLECELRDPVKEEGSRACRRLRKHNMVPGIIYGLAGPKSKGSPDGSKERIYVKTEWRFLQSELDRYRKAFNSRVYELSILDSEMEPMLVVPTDVQKHPVENKYYSVNYLRYYPGRPIEIPIVYINEEESAILKRGGFIVTLKRKLECVIEEGVPIPEELELECSGVKRKQVLKLDRINFPKGVKVSKNVNVDKFMAGVVFGKRVEEETVEGAEKEED